MSLDFMLLFLLCSAYGCFFLDVLLLLLTDPTSQGTPPTLLRRADVLWRRRLCSAAAGHV